jgi:hypothetical protein
MQDLMILILEYSIYFIVGGTLPLLIILYYLQKVKLRRSNLWTRILEFQVEEEYLRVYHYAEWENIIEKGKNKDGKIRKKAEERFYAWYSIENSLPDYAIPFLLTLVTTMAFAYFVYQDFSGATTLKELMKSEDVLSFAVAGGMLYIYPQYVSRFTSLHLSPPCLLELIGKLWLAVLLGILFGFCIPAGQSKSVAAFLGGYLPFTVLDILKGRVLGAKKDELQQGDGAPSAEFLEIIENDSDLKSQLNLMGIRTVLELAYVNPMKLFIETDLELDVCIYTVDRANLYLFVPDAKIRSGLNRLGIKTCVDLMTQVYDYEKNKWYEPGEDLPPCLGEPIKEIAQAMGLQHTDTARNLFVMMKDDPKLCYLLDFWQRIENRIRENATSLGGSTVSASESASCVTLQ